MDNDYSHLCENLHELFNGLEINWQRRTSSGCQDRRGQHELSCVEGRDQKHVPNGAFVVDMIEFVTEFCTNTLENTL